MKIVCVPLDKRPYNYSFLQSFSESISEIELILPDVDKLGFRKKEGDIVYLENFLLKQTGVDIFIISIEMLIYGGLFPSRIHNVSYDELEKRIDVFIKLRKKFPQTKVYVSNLIMRNPSYSSGEEEPEYYAEHGANIFRWGYLKDKIQQNHVDRVELKEWDFLDNQLDKISLDDYLDRRIINLKITHCITQLAKDKKIDVLFIPRDDTAEYGLGRMDRCKVEDWIQGVSNIYSHPGTDEAMCMLMARACSDFYHTNLNIFMIFSNSTDFIPKYEDIQLLQSLQSQINLINGIVVSSYAECDIVLAIHTPYEYMQEAKEQIFLPPYEHFLLEFADKIKTYIGKPIIIADIAYANGGDTSLVLTLDQHHLWDKCVGYAAWNTTGNTLGTCLCTAYFAYIADRKYILKQFMLERLLSDWVYQAIVRWEVEKELLPQIGATYSNFNRQEHLILTEIREKVLDIWNTNIQYSFSDNNLSTLNITAPFQRMSGLNFKL